MTPVSESAYAVALQRFCDAVRRGDTDVAESIDTDSAAIEPAPLHDEVIAAGETDWKRVVATMTAAPPGGT